MPPDGGMLFEIIIILIQQLQIKIKYRYGHIEFPKTG